MQRKQHPKRKWLGKTLLVLLALSVISVVTQVFWPGQRFMAFTKIGGVDVSNLTSEEARVHVAEIFTDHRLTITARDGTRIYTTEVPLDQIAIDAMIIDEMEYPLWQRLIPFSAFTRVFRSNWLGAQVNLDVDDIIAAIPESPQDAHLSIERDQITVTKAHSGAVLDREDLAKRLSTLRLTADGHTTLKVRAELTHPTVTDQDVATLLEKSPDTLRQNLVDTFRGTDLSIAAYGLKDGSWDISLDADRTWTSASTYKLYVAYYILKKVDDGEISYDSVKTCMERMIRDSDNSCPENWLVKYGFTSVDAANHAAVDLDHTLIASDNMQTSARDLSVFLTKLYRGELLSEQSTTRLLDIMKTQRYREGIPAGVTNNQFVADKVGFLYALLHDAAIVYSENGDYTLVIMTNHSSWSNIATLAELINNFNNTP